MSQIAEVKGLKELLASMQAYPAELVKFVTVAMSAALNIYWENVPPYPPKPVTSRTGTLGKSFGSDQQGGATSEPSIYRVKQLGGGNFEGTFGSNLEYASNVMGDNQRDVFKSIGWKTIGWIAQKAGPKVEKLFNSLAEKLAKFLEGKK